MKQKNTKILWNKILILTYIMYWIIWLGNKNWQEKVQQKKELEVMGKNSVSESQSSFRSIFTEKHAFDKSESHCSLVSRIVFQMRSKVLVDHWTNSLNDGEIRKFWRNVFFHKLIITNSSKSKTNLTVAMFQTALLCSVSQVTCAKRRNMNDFHLQIHRYSCCSRIKPIQSISMCH